MSAPGFSVTKFFQHFPDELSCLKHVVNIKIGKGIECGRCSRLGGWKHVKGTKKYSHVCGWQYSPLANTIMGKCNISLMAYFYGFLLIGNSKRGVKVNFLRKQLGIGMRAAHLLGIKIRTHIAFYDRPSKLGGKGKKVYVDEALLPCVRDWPKANDENVIVMGLACDGFVLCGIIADRTSATLVACIERFVEPGSILVTDGLKAYRSLERRGWTHIVVNHSVAFHDFEGNTTNQIEVFWSVLKRNLRAYRQVGRNHLWCYLAETEFAYNRRRAKRSMFEEIVSDFPPVTEATLAEARRRFDWTL